MRDESELTDLLTRPDGLVWVDIPVWDDEVEEILTTEFGFHSLAIHDASKRNHVPKVHRYDDHLFLVQFAPHPGERGHVHYIELDQFIGERYLVTVHGPINPAVDRSAAMIEVETVLKRLTTGKFRPTNGFELSHAMLKATAARMRGYVSDLTKEVWQLEQEVSRGPIGNAETFLDELFWVRHGLLTISTMAALNREVCGRMVTIAAFGEGDRQALLEDIVDRFHRLSVMADTQKGYLQGAIEFYQARTTTKMTVAAERLAMIAAVTAPVTAVSSVLGMNLIANDHTQWAAIWIAVVLMVLLAVVLLLWAKRRGFF
ncbi:CorA family divalent cation transporter [Mycolicibacterium komossense]|uniref:CorA family divalent cation transporter n=1 Tax=Mycolicibacterium komossense TaxID=1779 RepID=UPI0021F2BFF4|nr:CorA family divalent cation transporter [Mycolicibacterium komossense]